MFTNVFQNGIYFEIFNEQSNSIIHFNKLLYIYRKVNPYSSWDINYWNSAMHLIYGKFS